MRSSKIPSVACRACEGTGKVTVSESQFSTLLIVKRLKRAKSVDVWRHLSGDKIGWTGVTNRLNELHNLGLLKRTREGRAWVYSLTGKLL